MILIIEGDEGTACCISAQLGTFIDSLHTRNKAEKIVTDGPFNTVSTIPGYEDG